MNNMVVTTPLRDPRVAQAKKLAKAVIGTANLNYTDILIMDTNMSVMFVRDTAIFEVPLVNINPGFTILFNYIECKDLEDDEYIPCSNSKFVFCSKSYFKYHAFDNPNFLVAEEQDMQMREDIQELLNLKSKDGAKYYKMHGCKNRNAVYTVPFFAGLTSINKQDRFGIRVFDMMDGYFLVQYQIYKQKIKRTVHINIQVFNMI